MLEVKGFLRGDDTQDTVHAKVKAYPIPQIPPAMWILTSSGGSAQFAAHLGMGLSFAHFINPVGGPEVVAVYRDAFHASDELADPQVNVGIFAFCSEDPQKVADWVTEFDYRMLSIEMGITDDLPPFEAIKAMDYNAHQKARIAWNRNRFIAGTPDEVETRLRKLAADYNADEIMIATMAEDFEERAQSYMLIATMFQ